MSRMRDAIRSGWKTSKSFTPSPVLANMIGRPVTDATDRAAPPRASPSSLVSTTPVKSTPSWKAWAVSTAAWPIIASMTNSTSSGWIAARMSAACCMRFVVDGEAAGGVDDDDVVLRAAGLLDAGPRDGDRVAVAAGALAGLGDHVVAEDVAALGREHRHAGPLADDLELGDGVGALQVGGDEQRGVALVLEPAGRACRRASSCPSPAGRRA